MLTYADVWQGGWGLHHLVRNRNDRLDGILNGM
jgi:glycogen synthase